MVSKNQSKIIIKFRGVRGSHPVPGKKTLHYGGNTSCIEVRANGNLLIFDAGTGIISLGDEMFKSYLNSAKDDFSRDPMRFTIFLAIRTTIILKDFLSSSLFTSLTVKVIYLVQKSFKKNWNTD